MTQVTTSRHIVHFGSENLTKRSQ